MTVREIALALLNDYENSGKYANLSLFSHLLDKLNGTERAFLTHLFYTAVEKKLTYDYYACSISGRSLSDVDSYTLNILRLGFAQICDTESVPSFAAVNETVALCRSKGEKAFVNGVLRSAVRAAEGDGLPMPKKEKNPARYLSIKYSFPLAIAKEFTEKFGYDGAEKLLRHYNSVGYTDITVNTTKISVEELLCKLTESGLNAVRSLYSEIGIRIFGSCDVTGLYGFSEGLFFVQDEAGAVSAKALGVKPYELVVDTCAAPGGKSFAGSVLSEAKAQIHSFDIHISKLSLIRDGAKRLGFDNISVDVNDAARPVDELVGKADKVICDCPCSGLGVLGKKPDLRYRSGEGDENLPKLQYNILCASSGYLKVGGEMVYSTCTLRESENEEVVLRFLKENGNFVAVDFTVGSLKSNHGMLTLVPHIHNTDGFFIAKLKRIG